jgi:hypothetical protein
MPLSRRVTANNRFAIRSRLRSDIANSMSSSGEDDLAHHDPSMNSMNHSPTGNAGLHVSIIAAGSSTGTATHRAKEPSIPFAHATFVAAGRVPHFRPQVVPLQNIALEN